MGQQVSPKYLLYQGFDTSCIHDWVILRTKMYLDPQISEHRGIDMNLQGVLQWVSKLGENAKDNQT